MPIKQEKIDAVIKYLEDEFSGYKVVSIGDIDRCSKEFRVTNTTSLYFVKVERIVLDDITDIFEFLKRQGLGKFMRDNEDDEGITVLVTKNEFILLKQEFLYGN